MAIISSNNINDENTPVGVSSLGSIIFDNVVFPAGTFVDLEGNEQSFEEVKLDAVTISVNRKKRIVKSQVAGRDGDIKEYVSNGDYMIDLSAIIAPDTISTIDLAQLSLGLSPGVQTVANSSFQTSTNNPSQLLYRLSQLEKVPDRVQIRSKFLQNNYDITFVVIEDFRIRKITADTWSIDMQFSDDRDKDLKDFG